MRILLDTHTYLWWLVEDTRLSAKARESMADPESLVYVSAATIWELYIKQALGKLDAGANDLMDEIAANDFLELPITAHHAKRAGILPREHDDPFDRMLIAQAQLEGLTCVSRDPAFRRYDVPVLW